MLCNLKEGDEAVGWAGLEEGEDAGGDAGFGMISRIVGSSGTEKWVDASCSGVTFLAAKFGLFIILPFGLGQQDRYRTEAPPSSKSTARDQ